jgi:EAL and modified HD-GYP domain-containing signal transduction protein
MELPMLMSDFSTLLPPDKVVIEILESVQVTPELLDRVQTLKQAGFRFALDDFQYHPGAEPLLPLADYVKLDVLAQPPERVMETVKAVRRHPVTLVAEKVERQDQYAYYREQGFELFQGFFFAHPENLTAKVFNPSQATVLELMEKVRAEAEVKDIEAAFKRDVALTFKLLRYINSAGFGLSCEVQSIRHAVTILGYKPLYKWLTLLLITASATPMAPALTRTAITRGRLCELLGQHILNKSDRDNLFITGVFSLLDALLEMPMPDLLDRLLLPEAISDALLNRSGLYGPILALAEACESRESDQVDSLAESLILSPEQVSTAHLQALAWAEQLGLD